MFSAVIGLFKDKMLLVTLIAALAASGWLLLQAHQQIGTAKSETEQWQMANQHWSDFWRQKQEQLSGAENRLVKREQEYRQIQGQMDEYRRRLQTLNDGPDYSDADCRVSADKWLLIEESARQSTYRKLPGDKSGTTSAYRDP